MGEVINLRQARKDRERQASERQAEENRQLFGRSKAERNRLSAEDDKAAKRLEGHRLEPRQHDLPDEPA